MMNIEVIGISPTVNVFLDLGTMYRARSSHLKNLSVQKYNFLTTHSPPLLATPYRLKSLCLALLDVSVLLLSIFSFVRTFRF